VLKPVKLTTESIEKPQKPVNRLGVNTIVESDFCLRSFRLLWYFQVAVVFSEPEEYRNLPAFALYRLPKKNNDKQGRSMQEQGGFISACPLFHGFS